MADYDGMLALGVTTDFDAQKLSDEISEAFDSAGQNAGKVANDILDKLGNIDVDVSWDVNENSLTQVQKALDTNRDALKKTEVAYDVIVRKQKEYGASATYLNEPKKQAEQCMRQYRELNAELEKQIPILEKQEKKESRIQNSLREHTQELVRLRMAGKENTEEYRKAEQELGILRDAYGDAAQQAKVFADDNKHITGVMTGLQGLSAAFQVGTGVMGLFATENETLNRLLARSQQLMSVTMGLQQLANALNKDSAFRLVTINGLKKIWNSLINEGIVATIAGTNATKAHTTALEGQAAATTTVSTATKVLRGVMATVGLGAIIALISIAIKKFLEWRNATKEANKAMAETIAFEAQAQVAQNESKQKLDFYIASLKKKNLSMSEEKRLVNDLNNEYGAIFGTYNTAKDWLNVLIERENAYCRTLVNRKKIQMLMEQSDAKGEELEKVQATDAKDVEGARTFSPKKLTVLELMASGMTGGMFGASTDKAKAVNMALEKNQQEVDEYNKKNKALVVEGLQKGKADIDAKIRALEEQNFKLGLQIKPEVIPAEPEQIEPAMEQLQTDIVGEIEPIKIPAVPTVEEADIKPIKLENDRTFAQKLAAADKLEKATSKTISSAGKLAAVWNNKVGRALDNVSETMDETMDGVEEMIHSIRILTGEDIESMQETTKAAGEGIQATADGIQSACAVLAIISATLQLLTLGMNLIVKAHDAKYDRDIERQKKKLDALKDAYKDLEDQVSKTFGTSQSESYEQEIKNLEEQNKAYEKMIADEEDKKKTDSDAIKEYQDAIKENERAIKEAKISAQDAIFGNDIKSQIQSFAEAYVNAWSEGTDAAQSGRDMVTEMIKQAGNEAVKNVIQSSGLMDKLRKKMQDAMSDGIMTKDEIDSFYNVGDEITNMLKNSSAGWYEDYLEQIRDQEAEQTKEGLRKGIATASQDSVDENNARLAAIQMHTSKLSDNLTAILAIQQGIHNDTTAIREDVKRLYNTLDDMRIKGVKTI